MKWKDKPLGKMITHVQSRIVNPYIRERDNENYGVSISDNGSISDAGHYFSVGSHPVMRFRVDNIHGQSRSGNSFKGGDLLNYRKGLINRHGLAYVQILEVEEQFYKALGHKWTRFDVIAIAETYKYLHKNKIWIWEQEIFVNVKLKLINEGKIKVN